jgi:hypothetical protein
MPTAGKPTNRRRVCYTNGLRQNAPVAQLDRASASGAIQKLGSPQPTPTNRCKSGSAVFLTGRSRPIEGAFCGIRCTLLHTAPSAPEREVSSQRHEGWSGTVYCTVPRIAARAVRGPPQMISSCP